MSSKVTESVQEFVQPYAATLGLEVAEVEYQKKHNGMNLTIFIYKPDGVSIEDCEKLHRLINVPLDELNPTDDAPYTLNVSSLGLDRPFKTEADYRRNIGKEIEVKFYASIDGKKSAVGELVSFSDGIITIKQTNGAIKKYDKQSAAKVVLKLKI